MGEELRHVQMGSSSKHIQYTTWVKEANNNKGCEAESSAIRNNISLQKQVARVENNVYTYKP